MRCRRCGWLSNDEESNCPKCNFAFFRQTGEIILKQDQETAVLDDEKPSSINSRIQDTKAPKPPALKGSIKNTQIGSVDRFKPLILFLLSQRITIKTVLIISIATAFIFAMGVSTVYLINWISIDLDVPESAVREYPHVKALKIVQESPSSAAGKSVKRIVEEYAEKQQLSECQWSSIPDKINGNFAVTFYFIKDNQQRAAVWLVDLQKNDFKPVDSLAQSFSKR